MKTGKIRTEFEANETVCGYLGTADYPSAEAIAGDFDGDGKTEIAVVYKDDVVDVTSNFNTRNNAVFGRVNVTICKWNNGSFTRQNAYTSYNYSTGNFSAFNNVNVVGLRAARADLDGDGKDELVVLVLGRECSFLGLDFGYTEKVFPYLTRWYCDQGTITPKYDSSSLKGNGITHGALYHGNSALFSSVSDGTFYYCYDYYEKNDVKPQISYRYPYVQRAYSIASGPFTGTRRHCGKLGGKFFGIS